MHRLTRILPALVLLLALVVATGTAFAQDRTVTMGQNAEQNPEDDNFVFIPANITVNVGDTVTWRNTTQSPHTATHENGTFDSGNINPGGTFKFTFEEAGTYRYFCEYHSGQVGTVTVMAAGDDQADDDQREDDQQDDDQQDDDQQEDEQEDMPDAPAAGGGGMAGGAGLPVAPAAAAFTLFAATAYGFIRRRR